MEALEEERIDVVVGLIPDGWPPQELSYEPLSEEGLSVVVRPEHPTIESPTKASLRALSGFPWMLHPYTSPMRQIVDHAFLRAQLSPPDNVQGTFRWVAPGGSSREIYLGFRCAADLK
jgi:DNA-binding transcriptional LysR family regulator